MSGEDEVVVEAERVKLQLQDVVVLQNLKLSGWNYWTSLGGNECCIWGSLCGWIQLSRVKDWNSCEITERHIVIFHIVSGCAPRVSSKEHDGKEQRKRKKMEVTCSQLSNTGCIDTMSWLKLSGAYWNACPSFATPAINQITGKFINT